MLSLIGTYYVSTVTYRYLEQLAVLGLVVADGALAELARRNLIGKIGTYYV